MWLWLWLRLFICVVNKQKKPVRIMSVGAMFEGNGARANNIGEKADHKNEDKSKANKMQQKQPI